MFQEEGVAFTMRKIGDAPETVGHGMDCPEACIGECKAGKKTAQHGLVPPFKFFWVFDSKGQVGIHELDRFPCMNIGYRRTCIGDIGFDTVGQCVHAGMSGQLF